MKAALIIPPMASAVLLLLATGLGAPVASGQKSVAISPGMVVRDLPLEYADLNSLKEVLPDLLSKNGTHVILGPAGVIRITDTPEKIESVRKMIQTLSVPPANIRIVVTARSIAGSRAVGAQISGRHGPVQRGGAGFATNLPPGQTPGVIRQPTVNGRSIRGPGQSSGGRFTTRGGSFQANGIDQRGSTSSLNQQSLLVQSGREAYLEVVKEVPMIDYFTRYIVGPTSPYVIVGPNGVVQTFAPGGTFEVPEIRWEKAGSRLMVRPVAQGNLITIEVIPQITSIHIVNPQKFRDRQVNTYLTGADQYVSFTGLKTTVTVADGATVTIGGFSQAPPEFNRYFYGFVQTASGGAGSFTLRATIEPVGPPTGGVRR